MSGAIGHEPAAARSASLLHAARNAGWMLTGRAVQALLSLVYLAVAARTLGPADFGQFTLILTTGQAIVSLVSFQNWQVIVHFGMHDLQAGNRERLKRLTGFCLFLDGLSFGVGVLAAFLGTQALMPWLGWSAETADLAFAFAIVMLASLSSTPIGLLRLLDRFDAAAVAEAITPLVRAGGAIAAAWFGGGMKSFLTAWAAAELGSAIAFWVLARRTGMVELGLLRISTFRQAVADHPGLWRFALLANAGATLGYARRPAMQLLMGGLAGAAAAGNYRIGLQLSGAVSRLSLILSRALYPEFVRNHRGQPDKQSLRIADRALGLAMLGGVMLIILSATAGPWMIELLLGPGYRNACPLFLLLSAAAAADLMSAVTEPALIARGRAAAVMWAKLAATALLFVLAWLLFTTMGMTGVAWAALLTSLASAGAFWLMLRRDTATSR